MSHHSVNWLGIGDGQLLLMRQDVVVGIIGMGMGMEMVK